MTVGWWRRNAVSLGLVAVLLPVTAGVVALNEWSDWDLGHATKPITVEPGGAVDYAGAAIGPARARFADDPAAPEGTRLVSATVLVSPGTEPISCLSPQLREAGGAGRQWNEASAGLDRGYDPDRLTFCDSDLSIRYSLTLDYLVPEDAAGPFFIELASAAAIPQFVRLVIEP
ncbi:MULTISPECIES: hypothetical protein [unclassified Microbacterium]|uniref:hypothetical protein n=1 Tax=unclassified Microbacterium TaxID=2609290 RepID=UPI00214AA2C5|nr:MULTISPECIES: hypothetical protein [unclassified Microbacterium]MCR2808647.1 hypothetical protein [Microbacterium sp. zg.B185]WIM18920.1 hypothetical protein QNO12_15250 [Microbacterium sp. zg-B185]